MKKLLSFIFIIAIVAAGTIGFLRFRDLNTYTDLANKTPKPTQEVVTQPVQPKKSFPISNTEPRKDLPSVDLRDKQTDEVKKTEENPPKADQPSAEKEEASIPTPAVTPEPVKEEPIQEVKKIEEPKKEVSAPTPLKIIVNEVIPDAVLTRAGVIQFTNSHRAAQGFSALSENTLLNNAATLKAQDMFSGQYFAHVGPDGKEPSDWVKQVGYDFKNTGENLAQGNFESDQVLVQGWMDSPGHRANILKPEFTEIGVGVVKGMYEGRETWHAVQVFGKPMPICDKPEQVLQDQIDANQTKIDEMKNQLDTLAQEIETAPNSTIHNQKAEEYNALIPTYNDLATLTKSLVEKYNGQVNTYNTCIKQ